jgi:hypothetical protein
MARGAGPVGKARREHCGKADDGVPDAQRHGRSPHIEQWKIIQQRRKRKYVPLRRTLEQLRSANGDARRLLIRLNWKRPHLAVQTPHASHAGFQ